LLALLLLHANEVVSRDQMIEALWGERPPPSVQQSLDSYVSRLRGALGRDRILRRAPGYVLRVEDGEIDLVRFEAMLEAAHEASARGNPAEAALTLRSALELWRGRALADVLYEPFATLEAARLEERRLVALEERIDADLAAGGGAELVPELEVLVRAHPLRERLLAQLMLALYRAGRQADALEALRSAKTNLSEELGLDPRPQLRELERQILCQDPALEPAAQTTPVARRRRHGAMAVVAVAAASGVAVTIALMLGRESHPGELDAGVSRLAVLAGGSTHTALLEQPPDSLTGGNGSLWVASASAGTVSRVAPKSGAVVDRIRVPGQPGNLAFAHGSIWVASTIGGTVSRIDPATDDVTQIVRLGGASAASIAAGTGGLWVADPVGRRVLELETRTGSVGRTLTVNLRPTSLAVGKRSLWIADDSTNLVEEISTASGRTLSTTRVGNGPTALALGAGGLWVANARDGTVSRIEPSTGAVVATISVGSGPSALLETADGLWVANQYSATAVRIDPRRNRVAASVRVGGAPVALAAAGGRVWAGAGPSRGSHRGGTLRLVATLPFDSVDPAFQLTQPLTFTRLAWDSLVTLEPRAGPAGLRLVPDLAIAIPSPTRAGTTYAFRLRPGVRYSDGRRLRATDFRRGIERLFRVSSPGTTYYAGIVGASACIRRPRTCDLSRGIPTDDAAGTVSFNLRAPDPDFLFKLTVLGFSAPIPPGIPDRDLASATLPGTGPYTIVHASAREVRFERNRFFHEWSHAAQPDGNPDTVVWRVLPSLAEAVDAIAQGRADWMLGLIPPGRLHRLRLSHPAQLHGSPALGVLFAPLNSHVAPFDDVRVRRALNYAIDRGRIVRMYGGRVVATPLCQTLASGMPGYRRYCPYTAAPRRDGLWTAPDLPRARRLVAASGTRGALVDVWGTNDSTFTARELPRYFASVLRSLGYRTRLHIVSYTALTPNVRRRIQLSVDGDWAPDYPAPSSYLPEFFGCGGSTSNGNVCDRAIDRRMQQASALEVRDPTAAAAAWALIDRALADGAYWVPTVSLRAQELTSRRVRNYQFNPVWGFVADQVWLR
jgi:YVTN family beta-propeller protein